MRTALEINSETAAKLRKIAEARHVSIEELLAAHVPGLKAEDSFQRDSGEERVKAFDAWVADFPQTAPPLSDEAIDRASIYRDR